MSVRSREIRLKSRPEGTPGPEHFDLVEVDLPEPGEGQVLVRNLWMSVDPYMRPRMSAAKSYIPPFQVGQALDGGAIGVVERSNDPSLKPGDHVMHGLGWREHAVALAKTLLKVDASAVPVEAYLGPLGMPGMTAYVGLFRMAELKDGDVVFVSAAAGAVGQVACQLAEAHGCTVIASAGSAEKLAWLKDEAGVDHVIDYKTCGDLKAALHAAAPDGVDVYFDNVGGAHLEAALDAARPFGRFAMCGMIEGYNDTAPKPGPSNLMQIVKKSLSLRGFIVSQNADMRPAFLAEMTALIAAGRMKWRESVEEGLENAPAAFLKLFTGENVGKMLVRLGE